MRYTGDFSAIARDVQHAIYSVDRRLPISHVTTLDAEVLAIGGAIEMGLETLS